MRILTASLALVLVSATGGCDSGTSAPSVSADIKPTAVGQTGKAEGVEITVTAAKTRGQIGPAGAGLTAGPEETFVVVNYTIKNTSATPLVYFDRPMLTLQDGNGQTYAPDIAASGIGTIMTDPTGGVSDLNPGVSAKTDAVWKIARSGYDAKTWKVVVATDPAIVFALK